jgi:hypothetical protein
VFSWDGEVVTSVFVHVSLQGRTLYLEFSSHALPPTRAEYQVIDRPAGLGPAATAKAAASALTGLPAGLIAARHLAKAPARLWAAARPGKDLTAGRSAGSRADIGALVSARETAATDNDQSYFQFQDVTQHSKIIERRLIATVGDYLKRRDVDTSEFLNRAAAILNTGIINTGDAPVTVVGSALGNQATVINQAAAPGL